MIFFDKIVFVVVGEAINLINSLDPWDFEFEGLKVVDGCRNLFVATLLLDPNKVSDVKLW